MPLLISPRITEKANRTQGRYGAWKFNNPKKFILKKITYVRNMT